MYFTSREKGAIIYVAGLIAAADGRLAEEEKALTAAVCLQMGVEPSEAKLAESMELDEALSVISAMTPEEKRFVCSFLGTMCAIDGNVDKKEGLLWSLISARCSFPTMSIAEAGQNIKNYLL